jgi:hypothetical protein
MTAENEIYTMLNKYWFESIHHDLWMPLVWKEAKDF